MLLLSCGRAIRFRSTTLVPQLAAVQLIRLASQAPVASHVCHRGRDHHQWLGSTLFPREHTPEMTANTLNHIDQLNSETKSVDDGRYVFFFDIDNTLYSKKAGVGELMAKYIRNYIKTSLNLDDESAESLHTHYYRDFGLAIEGLVTFNHIDAMDYNTKVDDSLPLDSIIKPDPELRKLLERIDKSKVKLWLFTNAYVNHARRVIRLLGLEGIFDGVTYCDYNEVPLTCKPKPEMFNKAMEQAGVSDKLLCYFIDDSPLNVRASHEFGWKHTIHFREAWEAPPSEKTGHATMSSLYDLPKELPFMFKEEPESHTTNGKLEAVAAKHEVVSSN